MSRVTRALERSRHRPLVIPFVTAGYPRIESTPAIVRALAGAGADMIEIGMPFSDPLADGPVIQAASEQALTNGMTIAGVLGVVREVRTDSTLDDVPLILMGYCNPLFRYGLEQFVADAAAAGVDGLIIPDLPPGEAAELSSASAAAGLSMVFLMAPNTPEPRIAEVDAASTDFSYCVSITGVTGAAGATGDSTVEFLRRVARLSEKPFVVGFGVKNGADAARLGRHAAGVVVGSALIERISDAVDAAQAAGDFMTELADAARATVRDESDDV